MHRHFVARAPAGARRLFRRGLALAAAATLCVACGRDKPTTDPSTVVDPADPGPDPLAVSHWERPGVGHTSNIDKVALSADASVAVTRDQIGGTRLWPTLDGTREPIALPISAPQQFSVQPHPEGITAAAVDAAGGAKIFGIDERGRAQELGSIPPFQPVFEVHVLPGGAHCLALLRDHTLRIYGRDGIESSRVEQKRFLGTGLRVASDGRSAVALLRAPGTSTAKFQRLALQPGEAKGDPPTLEIMVPDGDTTDIPMLSDTAVALSAGGDYLAAVDKVVGDAWELQVHHFSDGTRHRVKVPVPVHLTPTIGFIDGERLLVSANDGGLSWLVDVTSGERRSRMAAPQDFINQGQAAAVGGGVQAIGYGSWLFVHDLETRHHRFVGYRAFQTQSATVAPDGEHVAWAFLSGSIFIDSLTGHEGERVEIEAENGLIPTKVRFVDDEHLLVIDTAGGMRLIEWRTGATVAGSGIQGGIRALHFDAERGLALVERHTNDVQLFEISADEIRGPYIVADQAFRAGLLRAGKAEPADDTSRDEPVLWTLDGTNTMRQYTLAELRADLSHSAIMERGEKLAAEKIAPLAIDSQGRGYGVRWNGSSMELFVDHGERVESALAPSGDISMIVPSPSGDQFVAVHQRGQTTSIAVHDSESLKEKWSFATGVFSNEIVWSADGRYVAVAGNTGAAVLDAATGEVVSQRCGMEFDTSVSPPPTAFNTINVRSACEG